LTLKSLSKLAKKSPNKKPPIHVVLEATQASQHEFIYCDVLPVRNLRYYFKNYSPVPVMHVTKVSTSESLESALIMVLWRIAVIVFYPNGPLFARRKLQDVGYVLMPLSVKQPPA
jgi:hypothetical protein